MDSSETKKTQIAPQRLKGFRDILPQAMFVRRHVIDTLRQIFELHGFAPLETPSLEYLATLEGKYGEDEKLIYRFEDHGGRRVGMRYDLTVPLARVVAMHQNDLVFPWKRYQIGPVWRGDNPQFGRYREFYQCDIDIVGTASMLADAEVLSILAEAMTRLGFTGYRVLINNRKLLSGIARSAGVAPEQAGTIFRAIDKLDKIGRDGVRAEMLRNGIEEVTAGRALDLYLGGQGVSSFAENVALLGELAGPLQGDAEATQGLQELRQVLDALSGMNVELDRFRIDTTLARGLSYYTGPVFEVVVDESKIGSLAGGGRYDELVGMFAGRSIPTTGVAFGMERIVDVITSLGMYAPGSTPSQALVTVFDASTQSTHASLGLASELRAAGIPCEVYLNPGDKLGKQFAYADKAGIRFALVLGPDELREGNVTVKELKAPPPNQQTVTRADLVGTLKRGPHP
ncbi:MAG TPA: histidine--tRNA ligase [Chloroflexia bacterium]|nr:histidine--tRNA ligase [Chloroflexia bacterium]